MKQKNTKNQSRSATRSKLGALTGLKDSVHFAIARTRMYARGVDPSKLKRSIASRSAVRQSRPLQRAAIGESRRQHIRFSVNALSMRLLSMLNASSRFIRFVSLQASKILNAPRQVCASVLRALEPKYISVFVLLLTLPFGYGALNQNSAQAAINEELHFQARLLTAGGSLVADGNYNVQFTIYSGGDGAPGGAAETTEWVGSSLKVNTEGVDVVNGYLSEQLGSQTTESTALSNVDWNNDTLWLTINIGDTTSTPVATDCDTASEFNSNCGGDGEMTPYIRLASTPYAFNSGQLEGRTASEFVQLDPGGTSQAVNTANAVIDVDQAGAGALVNLEQGSTQVFGVANNGDVTTAGDITVDGGTGTFGNASTRGSLVLYDNDAGSETITLQANSLASSLTFTLPSAYGSAGECLSDSDGAGALAWAACSGGGSSQFTDAGTFLYPSDLSGAEDIVIGGTTTGAADIWLQATGAAVFNEQGAAVNFRVEGDADQNLIFADGTNDRVGFGLSDPATLVQIDGTLTVGDGSNTNGTLTFENSTNANTVSLVAGVTTSSYSLTLPLADSTGTQCLKSDGAGTLSFANCNNGSGSGGSVTLQDAYDASTSPEIVVDGTNGALTVRDNSTPIGAALFEIQNNAGTTDYFTVSAEVEAS